MALLKKGIRKKKKPAVGFFGITGCAGCLLSFVFNDKETLEIIEQVDLKAFPFIKDINADEGFDIIFLEGVIANNEDLAQAKKLRKNTKILVGLGSCACTGCVPAYRHFIPKEQYQHLKYEKTDNIKDIEPVPLAAHVNVDYKIQGCPPDKREILRFIRGILQGRMPVQYDNPVCFECRRNRNRCLLDKGKPCLGSITTGGCNSVCINGGYECWGCRGPTKDANLEVLMQVLKDQGHFDEFIQKRLRTFAGLIHKENEGIGKDQKKSE